MRRSLRPCVHFCAPCLSAAKVGPRRQGNGMFLSFFCPRTRSSRAVAPSVAFCCSTGAEPSDGAKAGTRHPASVPPSGGEEDAAAPAAGSGAKRRVRKRPSEAKRKQRAKQRSHAAERRTAQAAAPPMPRGPTPFSNFCERVSRDSMTMDRLRVLEARGTRLLGGEAGLGNGTSPAALNRAFLCAGGCGPGA